MNKTIKKDEINLRELFRTIGHYKWSIIFFTLIITFAVAVKVYFMPKYYKSTITIEVKPEKQDAGGFSMGGAAAMLLGGDLGVATDLEKDATLLKTYRTNKKVLDIIDSYMIRYFITDEKYKEIEVEHNSSIEVSNVNIYNFEDYGIRLLIKPLNSTKYQLYIVGIFHNEAVGTYPYNKIIRNKRFTINVKKKSPFNNPYTIELAGKQHYIYDEIISKNLTIKIDKKSPFITISFLDNLPRRGESYLKNLIEIYTKQSIKDIKDDVNLIISSYNTQLNHIEQRVIYSSNKLENYKVKNSIIQPEIQANALVHELSNVDIEIAQNNYKQDLLKNLIVFAQKHQNIDAIAPSLLELQDQPTIELIKLIQEQQIALSELLIKYKPSHPTIQRANQTIFNLKNKVLLNLTNLQKTLKEKNKSLIVMKKSYLKKLRLAPKQEQKLINFSRNYEINEKMYTYLMQERSAAEIKRDKALSRFKIIESIYTPDKATKPKKALLVILSFFSALILMIFFSFFREFLKKGKENE